MLYGITFVIFITSLILFNAILFSLFYKIKPIESLKYYDMDYQVKKKLNFENNKNKQVSVLKILSKMVPNNSHRKKKSYKLEQELIKADIQLTVEELLVIKVLSSSTISFLSYALTKDIVVIIMTFIVVWHMPRFIIHRKKIERLKTFDEQINEGIMIISNALKAGYSFLQAVSVVVQETKDPFSKEFRKLLKEMSLGLSIQDSLVNMLTRIDSEDLRLIVNAILIQKDIGGNLSEILDNISITIRDRQKIQNELKTLTAQGKLSGIIIVLIPVFLGLIIYLFNKEYMILLFSTTPGLVMTGSAIISQLMGIIMINKIVKVEM